LYRSPTENAWDELVMKSAQGDEFIAGEKEIYVFCPNGYGRTKWTNNYFEKKLRVAARPATGKRSIPSMRWQRDNIFTITIKKMTMAYCGHKIPVVKI
jgi:hypothetical protein